MKLIIKQKKNMDETMEKQNIPFDSIEENFPEIITQDGSVKRTIETIKVFLEQLEDFQNFKADDRITETKNAIKENINYISTKLPKEELDKIINYCREIGIDFVAAEK